MTTPNNVPALLPAAPAATANFLLTTCTWDGARHWLTSAQRCEQLKLMCQVMLGFELQSLKKQHGISAGGDRKSDQAKSNSHAGNLISWDDLLAKETGLSQSTAYRFIDMARAAAPRLKKIPALKAFDPANQPVASLPEPQQRALAKAVKKITDGLTQKQFGEQFGLWKTPQGSGATGRRPGDGGRKKLSIAEQAELLKLQAAEDWRDLGRSLSVYRGKFTCLTDADVLAQIAILDQALTARKTWLKQALDARDPQAIGALFV